MKYFMQGTPWAKYETMMMSVPHYSPRGEGRRSRSFAYTKEDLDCKYCVASRGKGQCSYTACPFLAERLEAGIVSYTELVLEAFRGNRNRPLTERLKAL